MAVAGAVQSRAAPWRYSLPKSAPECLTAIPQIQWTIKEALLKQVDGLRDLARRARRLNDVATGRWTGIGLSALPRNLRKAHRAWRGEPQRQRADNRVRATVLQSHNRRAITVGFVKLVPSPSIEHNSGQVNADHMLVNSTKAMEFLKEPKQPASLGKSL